MEIISKYNSKPNEDRKQIIKQIKKYIKLNLEDRIHDMTKDIKKMSVLSGRDIVHLADFMKKEKIYSVNLLSYMHTKSHHANSWNEPCLNIYMLIEAIQLGNMEAVKLLIPLLISRNMDPTFINYTAIKAACDAGEIEIVKYLLSDEIKRRYPKICIDPSVNNNEPIRQACYKGHIEVVKYLLSEEIAKRFPESHIDPDLQDIYTLKFACERGYLEIVKFLLEYDIPRRFPKIRLCLMDTSIIVKSCRNGHLEVVKILLSEEIQTLYNVIYPSANLCYSIEVASEYGHLEVVKFLLSEEIAERFPSLIDPSVDGNNYPIFFACRRGRIDVVKFLLSEDIVKRFPKINPVIPNHNSALNDAIESHHIDIVKFLLSPEVTKRFPQIDPSDNNNRAMIIAGCRGSIEIFKFLLSDEIRARFPKAHIDPFAKNNKILKHVCRVGNIVLLKFLLKYSQENKISNNIDVADLNTALKCASEGNRTEVVKILLSDEIRRLFPNLDPSVDENRILIEATGCGNIEMIKILLEDKRVIETGLEMAIESAKFLRNKHILNLLTDAMNKN